MTDAHSQVLSRGITWGYRTASEVTQQTYLKGLDMPIDLLGCITTKHSPAAAQFPQQPCPLPLRAELHQTYNCIDSN